VPSSSQAVTWGTTRNHPTGHRYSGVVRRVLREELPRLKKKAG
jgi:hypothetical protein